MSLSDDLSGQASTSASKTAIAQQEKRLKMFYGVCRDDYLTSYAADKKRMKLERSKDGKKKETNAPAPERIPMPTLPESVKMEYRASVKDAQQRKYRISQESPPSVCLYTVLNAGGGLCSATFADNGSMAALGFGNSQVQVDVLAAERMKVLKEANELAQLDSEMDEFGEEMFEETGGAKSVNLVGHCGPVHSLSFSCDKRLLLSASRDATIRLWNLDTQRNVVVYRPLLPVWKAQFCNRGYYFAASTADATVSLWATDRIKPLRIFVDATDDVTELEFHPNCNYVIGGSEDKSIRVWDVLTGTCVRTFTDPAIAERGPVRGLRTSPCGRYLVAAYEEGTVGIWDMAQQKRLLVAQDTDTPFEFSTPIVFSRDASIVAVGTPRHGISFFSMEIASSAAHQQQQQTNINPNGFAQFSFATKRTCLLDMHFTRKNVVIALGAFEQ